MKLQKNIAAFRIGRLKKSILFLYQILAGYPKFEGKDMYLQSFSRIKQDTILKGWKKFL